MKSFVIKGTIFAVITAIIIQILNWSYMRTDPFDTDKFKNVPDGIQVCNVGASYSRYGFDYEDYVDEYITFNFGLSAQSAYYDYEILNFYREKLGEGAIVFIVLSYPCFLGKPEIKFDDFEQRNQKYYSFLPPNLIRNYDLKKDIKLKLTPFTLAHHFGEILKGLNRKTEMEAVLSRKTNENEISSFVEREWKNHFINNIVEDGQTVYLQETVDYINKIITLCNEENCMPVLLITPLTQEYKDYLCAHSDEALKRIYDIINKIQSNTGVAFYDYSEDPRFCNNLDLFCNGDHLNKEGAIKFTDIIMKEIVSQQSKK